MSLWQKFRAALSRTNNVTASEQVMAVDGGRGGGAPLVRAYGSDYTRKLIVNEQRDGIRTPWIPVQPLWGPADVNDAWADAEQGNLRKVASLIEAMRADGTIAGLMRTRTSIVRLPQQVTGDPYLAREWQGADPVFTDDGVLIETGTPGVGKVMCPIPALIDMMYVGSMAGIAPAELVPDPVTGIPVLTPRDLHWLRYDWGARDWIYQGGQEPYVVRPGDGRWVLYTPEAGPYDRPWKSGAWLPCSLAFVTKLAAVYDRMRWQAQLADPLKYFETEQELHEDYRIRLEDFLTNLWMRAPGIVLPAGTKAGMVESTGRGYDVYQHAEQWAEQQIAKALSGGQAVTSDGRGGLSDGGDLFRDIASSIIEGTAASLGECITTQVVRPWARAMYPWRMRVNGDVAPTVSIDARPPGKRATDAEVLGKLADSGQKANAILAAGEQRIDSAAWFAQCGMTLPLVSTARPIVTKPAVALPPSDAAPLMLPPAGTASEGDE